MTDQFDEMDHPELEPIDDVPPPSSGVSSNLKEAWRTRPLFKLLVIMTVVAAVIAAGASLVSNNGAAQKDSKIINPPDMHQPPGGAASPYFLQQTKEAEKRREQEALASGNSALPTPIGQSSGYNIEDKADPLNELRAETVRLKQQLNQVQQQQVQPQSQQAQQPEHFDDSLSQAMQQQMRQLLDSWAPKGIKQVVVLKDDKSSASGGVSRLPASSLVQLPAKPKTVVPSGTVSYAQLLVEANSDVPGPIMAQIVSGPLSGARAIGSFQIANGYNDYLVLHFTRANLNGKDYAIDAYALDPNTTLGGMATEVDQRYFTRVLLPAAAAFLQGLGSAIGQSNASTTVSNGLVVVSQPNVGLEKGAAAGMGQAARTLSQFFQNQASQIRPLVRVATGTGLGMFFVDSVVDTNGQVAPSRPSIGADAANYAGAGSQIGMMQGMAGSYNPYSGAGAPNPYAGYQRSNTGGYPVTNYPIQGFSP